MLYNIRKYRKKLIHFDTFVDSIISMISTPELYYHIQIYNIYRLYNINHSIIYIITILLLYVTTRAPIGEVFIERHILSYAV